MTKGTKNPMSDVPTINTKMCAFCGGKELATIGVTGMGFPMGEKCYTKANKRSVVWDENTTLKELKHLLRHGSER